MSDDTNRSGQRAEGPWTEEEVAAFARALTAFRDGLPPGQREAFAAIVAVAAERAANDDTQGHLFGTPFSPGELAKMRFEALEALRAQSAGLGASPSEHLR